MSEDTRQNARLQRQLESKFKDVGQEERLVLEMLAALYTSAGPEPISRCLRDAGARLPDGGIYSPERVRKSITKLDKRGLLDPADDMPKAHPLVTELAMREAAKAGRLRAMAQAIERFAPTAQGWSRVHFEAFPSAMREIRLALYQNHLDRMHQLIEACLSDFPQECGRSHPLARIASNPFDPVWLRGLGGRLFLEVLFTILNESITNLVPADDAFALLESTALEKNHPLLLSVLTVQYGLRGKLRKAEKLLRKEEPADATLLRAWLLSLRGKHEEAMDIYDDALRELRKQTGRKRAFFGSMLGLFYIFSLLAQDQEDCRTLADEYVASMLFTDAHSQQFSALLISWLLARSRGDASDGIPEVPPTECSSITSLVRYLVLFWEDRSALIGEKESLDKYIESARAAGYDLLACQAADLLARLDDEDTTQLARAKNLCEKTGAAPLAEIMVVRDPWERPLEALILLGSQERQVDRKTRVIWILQHIVDDGWRLDAREQKARARGKGWTKGRELSLRKLHTEAGSIEGLTEQDRAVCALIEAGYDVDNFGYARGRKVEYHLDPAQALLALVGHPFVYRDDLPDIPIEIVRGTPELHITELPDAFQLSLHPNPAELDTAIQLETPTRLRVTPPSSIADQISEWIGPNGLQVPAAAGERLRDVIGAISPLITVQSDLQTEGASAEMIEADPRPHVHILPHQDGVIAEVYVRPLGERGSYYRPGAGGTNMLVESEGAHLRTRRCLETEKRNTEKLIGACPTLQRYEDLDLHWQIEQPEDCLELLIELQTLGDAVVCEWPQGGRFSVRNSDAAGGLRLQVRGAGDWLGVSASLAVDEERVLDMRQLLELSETATGRFIKLGDDEWLALTDEFRRRLDELRSLGEMCDDELRFHPLAAPILEAANEWAASVEGDTGWQTALDNLHQARAFTPEVPTTLQTELRDYQRDGYLWLARLARWGVGACLADDMGLGKTVQALTLILDRAPDGPTLVIAPTSVGWNWLREAARFAPTLRAALFSESNREAMLAGLQPYDLVICSYGLLQQEEEMLAGVEWQTIVLDEAQAIKNTATKRSKAAMKLNGKFKLITTGTPLENHLGELWNLFRFINPGLLGSQKRFQDRFAQPIERDNDAHARARLKTLLQPFILRRTKSQVLEELPPRTEILKRVTPHPDEAAFYEALRREALEKVETDTAPGAKAMTVLAQIMRLRRACCNPKLVQPDTAVPSSKLIEFEEILDELLENRHKCLVFSQFVDHLAILRKLLESKNISYQYLDGSTPPKKRRTAVESFQAGAGDVFLISLKAGGQGLNLTAADYVIHMDPWWNPAVEDQASDRAHRIGQQRPVTIYRLVSSGTIEEKIVELHARKRDLADSLLAGTESAGRLDADALLQLLRTEATGALDPLADV